MHSGLLFFHHMEQGSVFINLNGLQTNMSTLRLKREYEVRPIKVINYSKSILFF